MGNRVARVEKLLQREIADFLLFGGLRDPRLDPPDSFGITGIKVAADLSVAKVYVDVMDAKADRGKVLAALNRGAGVVRREVGDRVQLRRMPKLSFVEDAAIQHGANVERILSELTPPPSAEADSGADNGEDP